MEQERIEAGALVKTSVNFPVELMVDMDKLRGKYISRPVFIKMAVDYFVKDLKRSKKNILEYANESM